MYCHRRKVNRFIELLLILMIPIDQICLVRRHILRFPELEGLMISERGTVYAVI